MKLALSTYKRMDNLTKASDQNQLKQAVENMYDVLMNDGLSSDDIKAYMILLVNEGMQFDIDNEITIK